MEIVREDYLEKVNASLGKGLIIVLVGQRRVGKSCLLHLLKAQKEADPDGNVIYIDKEKREFDSIQTYEDLNSYIGQHWNRSAHNYILIDEVQDIAGFERSLRSYRTEADTDIIVTGSNAKILSTELSTLIGGRYKEIHVLPLSYKEFLNFHHLQDSDDTLGLYLNLGGMPGLQRIGLDEAEVREYQSGIYHTALLKDVVMRNEIRNPVFLENLLRFVGDNIGKLISANSLSKYMKGQGEKIAPAGIINYLRYLAEAYVIKKVNRYDIHGKRLLETNEKYYFEDNGIRNAIVGGNREGDIEKVIENVVYLQLIRMGYDVCVGQLQAGEVDFVCTRHDGQRLYVQASYLIIDPETREREFGNLASIKDNYPKYVISMTPLVGKSDYEGITHLHLRRFLQNGFEDAVL